MAKRHYEQKFTSNSDPRRSMEREGEGMIREDHSAVANLPQGVIQKQWPEGGKYMPMGPDDTIAGVDRQMDRDSETAMRHMKPRKA